MAERRKEPMQIPDAAGLFMDVSSQIRLRMKLFLSDKITLLVYFLSIACFLVIFKSLSLQAENRAAIPIGVVDRDALTMEEDSYSARLVQELFNISSLTVRVDSFENLKEQLLDGYISAIFVIESGYEERILKGDVKNLISLYQASESKTAALVADIVAGEMLYQICLAKGMLYYDRVMREEAKKHNLSFYEAYAEELKHSEDFDFTFDVSFVDGEGGAEEEKRVSNSLLYRQMIVGIAAMMYSFVILFALTQTVNEKAKGIRVRKKVTVFSFLGECLGNLCATLLLLAFLCMIFAGCFAYYAKPEGGFFMSFFYSLCYCIMMWVIFEALSRILPGVFSYQLLGAVIIIAFGIAGFCTMLEGIVINDMGILSELLPNSRFIKSITKLM